MGEYAIERPWHFREFESVDEKSRIANLPAPAGAHESPKLLIYGPSPLRRLLLHGPK
jgi:hypothetical protein